MSYELKCINCGDKFYVNSKMECSSRLYCDNCQKKVVSNSIEKIKAF